ncbi:hypothetical protein O181_097523 [Austropuccinia psidii MF-1]|uniref:Uncharacterized protein n=1 Tax=Austropuccinia psidii MF-1 TaxID=1389203 RepID=A0A9Q3PD94_9BASI|nr:hypothetical protein [Austropuccinia psidii MF-1]
MSSKLTELTESSPSAPPLSVLCGSGVFSQLSSPSMVSSGHFDASQTYDGFRAVEVLDPACTDCFSKGKDCFQHQNPQSSKCHFCFIGKKPCCCTRVMSSNVERLLWSRKDGPFGQEFPVSEEPTPDATSGVSQLTGCRKRDVARWTSVGGPIAVGGKPIYSSSEVPISRTNTEGVVEVVKRVRRIDDSPTDLDDEGSDELDCEEVQVVPHSVGHPSSNSSTQPLANRFQSQVIPSTPRTFHPYYHSSSFTKYFPCQACLESSCKTITSSAIKKLTHNHLPPTPTCGQLQQKKRWIVPFAISCCSSFFKEENVSLSGLPEKIPTRLVKTKKLWPDYSGGLIEIAER